MFHSDNIRRITFMRYIPFGVFHIDSSTLVEGTNKVFIFISSNLHFKCYNSYWNLCGFTTCYCKHCL